MKVHDRQRVIERLAEWRLEHADLKQILMHEGVVEFAYYEDATLAEVARQIPPVYEDLVDEGALKPPPIEDLAQTLQHRLETNGGWDQAEAQLYGALKDYFEDTGGTRTDAQAHITQAIEILHSLESPTAADRHAVNLLSWYTEENHGETAADCTK